MSRWELLRCHGMVGRFFAMRHSHGGTRFGSTHSPRLAFLATVSNRSRAVSEEKNRDILHCLGKPMDLEAFLQMV